MQCRDDDSDYNDVHDQVIGIEEGLGSIHLANMMQRARYAEARDNASVYPRVTRTRR